MAIMKHNQRMEHSLQISIDNFGRIVLPKPLRDRLGIRPGMSFLVSEEKEKIILSPTATPSILVRKKGLLVAMPEKDESDSQDLLQVQRQERDGKF